MGDRIEPAREGIKGTTRRPTTSNNLGPWSLPEAELPTIEHAGTRPMTSFIGNVQLDLYVDQLEQGLSLTLMEKGLPFDPFSLPGLTSWTSVGE